MSEAGTCPNCGAPLSDPGEPCQRCLLAHALEGNEGRRLGPGFLDDLPAAGDVFVIADKYEVRRILGRGGMGVVYLAWQANLDRVVALKMLTSGRHASPEALRRFLSEAKATAALNHPHIVKIHDWGEDNRLPYFSMEYIEGQDLAARTQHGPLASKQAAELIRKVALAVAHANEHGIIHRDLKPSNVLLGRDGEPKVVDFGLAKRLDAAAGFSVEGQVLGTPVYLATEQLDSSFGSVDQWTDVYGLGALFYHLLTGRAPFLPAASEEETLRLVRETDPVPLRRLNPALPRDLETICLKCLAKSPSRRYATAQAFADDVGRWERGEPIQARPVGSAERVWIWARRKPALASLTLLLGLTAVVATVALAWGWRTSVIAAQQARASFALQSAIIAMRGGETRRNGWSELVEVRLRGAAQLGAGEACRDQFVAWMAGLDARRVAQLPATNIAQVYLPPDHDGLLLVGLDGVVRWKPGALAHQDGWTERRLPSARVALPARAPFALLLDDERQPVLWDLFEHRELARLRLPDDLRLTMPDAGFLVAVSCDASTVVAALTEMAGQARLGCWSGKSGRLTASISLMAAPTAIALSPDGVLVAVGDDSGTIITWNLSTGAVSEPIGLGTAGIARIEVGESNRRQAPPDARKSAYLVAAGDESGAIAIWDAAIRRQLALCRGTAYRASALAFSPDNLTLASGGHDAARLWDIATGKCLLKIDAGNQEAALAFSRDGRHLVIAAQNWGVPPGLTMWRLEPDRGLQVLRGLSSGITKVAFSPNGTRVAAVSMAWEIGVWDLASGFLLHVLQGSHGYTADNCGLAFSPDGESLAFSAGRAAQLWNLNSGRLMACWSLPPGLVDALAYPRTNALYLLRFERSEPDAFPPSDPLTSGPSRVCRLRNLMDPPPSAPFVELLDFERGCLSAEASADGAFLAVEGRGAKTGRFVCAIATASSKVIWRASSVNPYPVGSITFGSYGALLCYSEDGTNWIARDLHTMATQPLRTPKPAAIGPEPGFAAKLNGPSEGGPSLTLLGGSADPLNVALPEEPSHLPRFDAKGGSVAWGTLSGSLVVCHPSYVSTRLEGL